MCSSSDIEVDGLGVCLDIVLKLMEIFKGGFITDGSEVISLKEVFLVINRVCHGV